MELNIWNSSKIQKIERDSAGKGWVVKVTRADGSNRDLKPRHIVFAHGFGGGLPNMPQYPGQVSFWRHPIQVSRHDNPIQDKFKGKIVHSSAHRTAKEHKGKKVVVVGACTSGTFVN